MSLYDDVFDAAARMYAEAEAQANQELDGVSAQEYQQLLGDEFTGLRSVQTSMNHERAGNASLRRLDAMQGTSFRTQSISSLEAEFMQAEQRGWNAALENGCPTFGGD
jgi:hypothetical protein